MLHLIDIVSTFTLKNKLLYNLSYKRSKGCLHVYFSVKILVPEYYSQFCKKWLFYHMFRPGLLFLLIFVESVNERTLDAVTQLFIFSLQRIVLFLSCGYFKLFMAMACNNKSQRVICCNGYFCLNICQNVALKTQEFIFCVE